MDGCFSVRLPCTRAISRQMRKFLRMGQGHQRFPEGQQRSVDLGEVLHCVGQRGGKRQPLNVNF